ncbi:truncated FRIGIDA-like protein 1 [Tasmannia lanceolata]|uniref:truncated FRIGIDA-like protein 1 n=1 Tax=Tasmannia lanceolata TaxID=3420 RepID=UPI00406347F3
MSSSTESISAAIKSIPSKKESLRKAFQELQSHSSSFASFTLQWEDLETHIDSMSKSFESRLKDLESKDKQNPPLKKSENPENPSKKPEESSSEAIPRPELKSFCENMDGKGIRSFIIENKKQLFTLRNEIGPALRFASDPAKMVLDAMDGFYSLDPKSKRDKDMELGSIRKTSILLLERLLMISPEIKNDEKERAKNLAVEWKGKISPGGENPLEVFAFLQLLVSYGLVSLFDVDELLDLAVFIHRRKQIDFIRALDFTEKVPDFIQKLVSKGKQLDAVNFVYAFELVNKFPPVPLLKAYLKESEKVAEEIRKEGNYSTRVQNEAKAKEIAALKAVIKSIEEHKLESEFSTEDLEKRISQLEQQKADKNLGKRISQLEQPAPDKKPRPAVPYDHSGPGFGFNPSPSMSELYSSEHLLGSSLFDKPSGYSGLPLSTLSGGLPYRSSYLP